VVDDNIESKIIDLLNDHNPRPDREECIEALSNCLQAFIADAKDVGMDIDELWEKYRVGGE